MRRSERGLTLTEVTVVGVLAILVFLGLMGFYLSSQGTWIDASSQALAQRDATMLVSALTTRVRESSEAFVSDSPDAGHQQVQLVGPDGLQRCRIFWDAADSLVYLEDSLGTRALVTSRVDSFVVIENDSLVELTALRVRYGRGESVRMAGAAGFYNR